MFTLRFDGLFRGIHDENETKAGFMCIGWVILKDDLLMAQGHGVFLRGRDASSNVAEYLALIEGLDALLDLGVENDKIKVFGDAKSVIDQMRGQSAVNSEHIWPLYMRARSLANQFPRLHWVWMPRKHNKAADWLTRRAMKQIRHDEEVYQAAVQAITTRSGRVRRSNKLLSLIDLRIYQPACAFARADGSFNPLPHLEPVQ